MGILFLSPRVGRPDHLPVLGEIDSVKGVTAGKAIKNIPRTLDVEASWTELLAFCPSVPRSLLGSQMLDELSLMARGKDRLTTSIQERKKILSVICSDKVKTAHLLIRVARAIENLTTIAVHVLSGLDHPNAHMVPMESLTHIKLNRVCPCTLPSSFAHCTSYFDGMRSKRINVRRFESPPGLTQKAETARPRATKRYPALVKFAARALADLSKLIVSQNISSLLPYLASFIVLVGLGLDRSHSSNEMKTGYLRSLNATPSFICPKISETTDLGLASKGRLNINSVQLCCVYGSREA